MKPGVLEALPLSSAADLTAPQATLPPTRLVVVYGQEDAMAQGMTGDPLCMYAFRPVESYRTSFDVGSVEPPVIFTYTLSDGDAAPAPPAAPSDPLPETMAVPEPSSLLLVGLGVIGLAGIALRRRRRVVTRQ